jgi:hypothetical protein
MTSESQFRKSLREAVSVYESLLPLEPALETAGAWCVEALRAGRKVLTAATAGAERMRNISPPS